MIASVYRECEESFTKIANCIVDKRLQAKFIADDDWRLTHYSLRENLTSPIVLTSLKEPVTVEAGGSVTLDLKHVYVRVYRV